MPDTKDSDSATQKETLKIMKINLVVMGCVAIALTIVLGVLARLYVS
jgi:hypothetical protein